MSTPQQELELGTESVQAHARLLRFILAAIVVTHLLLISAIWGQWKNIAIITAAFFFVALFNMMLARPVFSSRTQVAVTGPLAGAEETGDRGGRLTPPGRAARSPGAGGR